MFYFSGVYSKVCVNEVKKRAVITIAIGDDPAYRYGLISMRHYAKRIGCEFVVINSELIASPPHFNLQQKAWLQKIAAINLSESYDEILYLDSDILVNPEAPDFFSWIGEGSPQTMVAMYDESHLGQREQYLHKLFTLAQFESRRVGFDKYFNVGVVYLRKGSRIPSLIDVSDVVAAIDGGVPCPEQTYLNHMISEQGIQVLPLPRAFNYMQEGSAVNSRFTQFFIHYAGYSFRSRKAEKRSTVMRKDFFVFFGNEKSNIKPQRLWVVIDFYLNMKFSFSKKLHRMASYFRGISG